MVPSILLAVLGGAVFARAQDEVLEREPIHVRVDDATSCLSAARFFDQVHARTSRVRLAEAEENARTFVVSVNAEGTHFVGRLVLVQPTGPTEPRIVRASSCDEATSALALAAAVSIDAVGGTATAPVASPASSVPTTPSESVSASMTPPDTAHWMFAVGGRFEVLTQPPEAAPGGGAFLAATLDRADVFAPEVRLGGMVTAGTPVTTPAGSAQPVWLTLDLSLCPFRVAGRVLAACADFEGGTLQVNSTSAGANSPSRPWLAPGLSGRLSWPGLALTRRAELLLDAEVGARVPLERDTFYFLDNPSNFQVYAAPTVVGHASVDVGLRFW